MAHTDCIVQKEEKVRLWNLNFIKVFIGNFLLYFAFQLIVPLLPLYLKDNFNADKQMIGFVLSGYTLAALIIRPFGGYFVDSFSRKKVLLICYFVFFIFFAGYIAAGTLLLFAIIRSLHGFSFGSLTVANTTMAIDVLDSRRRAEGIGYFGLSNNAAMALGPTTALLVFGIFPDFDYLFALSLVSAGIGFAVVCSVKPKSRDFKAVRQPISLDRFFLLKGWRLGVSISFYAFAFGVLSTYLAIYGKEELGITNGTATYFLLLALGLMMSRLIGSKTLRQGKIAQNAAIGGMISVVGYSLFALVHIPFAYYASAIIIGLGNGHMYPAYQNMFINLAPNSQRGTANSTLLTSWDIGMGLGVLVGGSVAQYLNYNAAFLTAAASQFIGCLIFFVGVRNYYERHKLR